MYLPFYFVSALCIVTVFSVNAGEGSDKNDLRQEIIALSLNPGIGEQRQQAPLQKERSAEEISNDKEKNIMTEKSVQSCLSVNPQTIVSIDKEEIFHEIQQIIHSMSKCVQVSDSEEHTSDAIEQLDKTIYQLQDDIHSNAVLVTMNSFNHEDLENETCVLIVKALQLIRQIQLKLMDNYLDELKPLVSQMSTYDSFHERLTELQHSMETLETFLSDEKEKQKDSQILQDDQKADTQFNTEEKDMHQMNVNLQTVLHQLNAIVHEGKTGVLLNHLKQFLSPLMKVDNPKKWEEPEMLDALLWINTASPNGEEAVTAKNDPLKTDEFKKGFFLKQTSRFIKSIQKWLKIAGKLGSQVCNLQSTPSMIYSDEITHGSAYCQSSQNTNSNALRKKLRGCYFSQCKPSDN